MNHRVRAETIALFFLSALFAINSSVHAQDPTPSPSPESAVAQPAVPPVAHPATPEPDFWHQETMTGDWGGARSRRRGGCVEVGFEHTKIYQRAASAGV